tara:strand:+ start:656 stop:889 length:234 start_codon:yes stop_codon:yes gene_type:complete
MKQIGNIRKLERTIQGHSFTVYEVGKEISEIKDCGVESSDGSVFYCWNVHYRSGVVVEIYGGIITVTRNAVSEQIVW